jgi:hypothetical protein
VVHGGQIHSPGARSRSGSPAQPCTARSARRAEYLGKGRATGEYLVAKRLPLEGDVDPDGAVAGAGWDFRLSNGLMAGDDDRATLVGFRDSANADETERLCTTRVRRMQTKQRWRARTKPRRPID